VPGGAPTELAERFEVGYVDGEGPQRLSLTEVWSVPFESCQPAMTGQLHPPAEA
jgi:hypothetical protein